MFYDALIREGTELLSALDGYDPSYTLIYYNNWMTYDDGGWKAFLSKDGRYFVIENTDDDWLRTSKEEWKLEERTFEQVLTEIEEFEILCAE